MNNLLTSIPISTLPNLCHIRAKITWKYGNFSIFFLIAWEKCSVKSIICKWGSRFWRFRMRFFLLLSFPPHNHHLMTTAVYLRYGCIVEKQSITPVLKCFAYTYKKTFISCALVLQRAVILYSIICKVF